MPAVALALYCTGALGCAGDAPPRVDTPETVRALLDRGSYAEAEQAARRLLAQVESPADRQDVQSGDALDLLVEALWRAGKEREPETAELARRAVDVNEKRFGARAPRLAASLTNLGTVLRRTGDIEQAEQTLDRARTLVIENGGPEDVRLAPIVTQIGILRLSFGDSDAAHRHLEHAIRILEHHHGADHPALADPLRALGVLHRRSGDYAAATVTYERLLELEQRHLAEDSPDRARSLNSYAALLQNVGDYAGARQHFERALAIRRRTLPADHPDIGANLNNLAIVLQDIGDQATASQYYEEALGIMERQLGPDHPYVADVLNNYADALRRLGRYDEARSLLERALGLRERTLDADHRDIAQSVTNLAILASDMGDDASARPLYERALSMWTRAVGPDHLEVAECANKLAALLARAGEALAAQEMFRRALAIREKAGGADHPLVAETLTDAAYAALHAGHAGEALELALRAHRIGHEHVRLTARTLTEREALGYGASRVPALDVALTVAALGDTAPRDSAARVWDAVIRSRALVLDEMALRHRLLGDADDPELARRVEKLNAARANLAELWVRGAAEYSEDGYRRLLDQAHAEKERAETELARASLEFRRQRERAAAGLHAVRAALAPGSALLAYVRVAGKRRGALEEEQPRYVAFVGVGPTASPVAVPLGAAGEVEQAIEAWRAAVLEGGAARGPGLRRAESRYRETATRLRERVWDPVAPHLDGANRVLLVADGALNLVSFAALPDDDGHYLVEGRREILHLVTERDLLPASSDDASGTGLLALGGVAYDLRSGAVSRALATTFRTRSTCGAFQSLQFAALPESEREVDEIAETWGTLAGVGAARVLTAERASEDAFKTLAPRHRVVHLATHGFFLGGACATVDAAAPNVALENPLLLSGLALAGANQRGAAAPGEEDGILTAEEIAALDLSRTEWVVLSACDTGLGAIRAGEDVFGLRRAFQIAGARRVVMSLWQVDDLASRRWMTAFYDAAFIADRARTDPARNASRRILEERRRGSRSTHPYFWAGFVATGL